MIICSKDKILLKSKQLRKVITKLPVKNFRVIFKHDVTLGKFTEECFAPSLPL